MNSSPKNLRRTLVMMAVDTLLAALSLYISIFARFYIEYSALPLGAMDEVLSLLKFWLPVNLLIFIALRMYNRLWEYASIREAIRVITAATGSFLALIVINEGLNISSHRSCYPLIWIVSTAFALLVRFQPRIVHALRYLYPRNQSHHKDTNIMIIGAGHAANSIMREIARDKRFSSYNVVCAIDDDLEKQKRYLGNAKVVGGRNKIVWAAQKYEVDEIIFAIPSADSDTRREIFNICKETNCSIKTLPSYYQMLNNNASMTMLRKVEIADLLERPQITLELDSINEFISGKTVLVTGAGGSIGSELCRQVAKYNPKQLVLFDIYENNVYFVQNELKDAFPELKIATLIGSVRDTARLDYLFSTYQPDIVYHAAAHKHVPLMEDSPNEAVKNNVFGTLNTVKAADRYGVKRFVMISTDKAVNPTNVMGATKRICEMIIQSYNRISQTEFVAVRFGNVLGSNGSVIPLFEKQIEAGGPVTVTHPEIIRYFMTIPEAVSLVLQAGSKAEGGEIFILDMGKPVKILTLAENMIRLKGLVPYEDINIVFSGLRPGEKIFEELLMSEEGLTATKHKRIFVSKPIDIDTHYFFTRLDHMYTVMSNEHYDIRPLIKKLVPTYLYDEQNTSKIVEISMRVSDYLTHSAKGL